MDVRRIGAIDDAVKIKLIQFVNRVETFIDKVVNLKLMTVLQMKIRICFEHSNL